MWKTCNVVMLPTNEKAKGGDLCFYDNKLIIAWLLKHNGQPKHHIYITSDEEIKVGDWFYYEADKTIMQCTEHNFYFTPELIQNYSNVYRIIVTTDTSLKLPNISQQFIEKYIEEYNKGNVITEVMVEYKENISGGWIPSYNNPDNNNCEPMAEPDGTFSLIVNSDNTINIKPIKDSWNNIDLVEFFKKLVVRGCFRGTESKSGRNYNIAVQSFKEQFNLDYEQEVDNL